MTPPNQRAKLAIAYRLIGELIPYAKNAQTYDEAHVARPRQGAR